MTSQPSKALVQRWVVTLHMTALAAQIVLALLWLGGYSGMLPLHWVNARVVLSLAVLQAIVVTSTWPTSRSLWKTAAVAVVLLEALQIAFGRAGYVATHVTLGTAIWGLGLGLLIQVWAPRWGTQALRPPERPAPGLGRSG